MTTASPTRSKALAALREGRLRLKDLFTPDGATSATFVQAVVSGYKGRHDVELVDGTWSCSCGRPQPCAHVTAAQLVTGHAGSAPDPAGAGESTPPAPADTAAPKTLQHGGTGNGFPAMPLTGPSDVGSVSPPEIPGPFAAYLTRPGWTTAARAGTCIGCGGRYDKGEPIRMTSTPAGTRWSARCCAEDR